MDDDLYNSNIFYFNHSDLLYSIIYKNKLNKIGNHHVGTCRKKK